MAPLRSSRHTRHHDPNTTTRAGRATTDFDPTDGLPVRRFILESMSINQDASVEATDPANSAAAPGSKPGAVGGAVGSGGSGPNAAAGKDAFPWPEQSLPPFFDQLPLHNQELLRRARAGERETKASIWDRKAHEWVRYDEARKRGLTGESGMLRKSRYLMSAPNEDGDDANANEDNDDDDASDDGSDDEAAAGAGDGTAAAGGAASGDAQTTSTATAAAPQQQQQKGKKRKVPPTQLLQDRTFEVKKWTQIPFDKADKMPEAKYLADRRAGMGNFYNQSAQGAWAQAQGYGVGIADGGTGSGPGYDLGDGSGLGNAMGGQPGNETPVRKNMPPRPRKKKGGPGRKKKEVVEAERRAAEEARRKAEAAARGETVEGGDGEGKLLVPGTVDGEAGSETPRSKKEGDASGDDSEGDGSEEGEVNEGNESAASSAVGTPTPTPTATTAAAASASVPGLGLGLNAPAIPSSLSREVAVAATEDTTLPDAGPVAEDVTEPPPVAAPDTLPPPQLDAQMTDAPAAVDTIPPPSAEPSVPETIVDAPVPAPAPASLSSDAGAGVGVAAADSPSVSVPAISADTTTVPSASGGPEDAAAAAAAPAAILAPEPQAESKTETEPEISVPFAPLDAAVTAAVDTPTAGAAAGGTTPAPQGIDEPAAAATAAPAAPVVLEQGPLPVSAEESAAATSAGLPTMSDAEAAVREAVVQGEAREFARVEAVAERDGDVDMDKGEGGDGDGMVGGEVGGTAPEPAVVAPAVTAEAEAEAEVTGGEQRLQEEGADQPGKEGKENEGDPAEADLLGGLERAVDLQQGGA